MTTSITNIDPTLVAPPSGVSRYRFTSGNVTADDWGSNTLTDNTSAGTTTDAIRGDAKSFDGTDDNMSMPSFSAFSAYSLSLWVNPNSINDSDIDNYLTIQDNQSVQVTNQGDGTIYFYHRDSGGGTNSLTTSGKNEWQHITATWDGDLMRLFKNGSLQDSLSGVSGVDGLSRADYIGARGDGSGGIERYLDGDIDDVRIYDRALSAAEVFQLYQWGTKGSDGRKRLVRQ